MSNVTRIILLVDESGSMYSIRKDMEEAIRGYLREQRNVGGQATVSAYGFDCGYNYNLRVNTKYQNVDIQLAGDVAITPGGGTPLHSAMVETIKREYNDITQMSDDVRPDRVVFITITDGYENASKGEDTKALPGIIKDYEENHKWNFLYFGANQNIIDSTRDSGIQYGKALAFDGSQDSIHKMSKKMSDGTTRLRSVSNEEYTSVTLGKKVLYAGDSV